jgi:transketolase
MSTEHVSLQPLHTADGKVYAYVVPAEELERLRATESVWLKIQADYERKATAPKATPEEEAEFLRDMRDAVPDGLDRFIEKLDAEGYGQ